MPACRARLGWRCRREHAAQNGVVQSAVHVNQVEVVIVLVQGIASVEGMGHVAIPEANRIAPPPPGIIAQPLHGVAADGGRQAALVVFQGIVHGASSVVVRGKDSKQSSTGGQIMQLFCHAIFGNGFIKRREIAFRAGSGTIAEGLHHALAVDAVAEGFLKKLHSSNSNFFNSS